MTGNQSIHQVSWWLGGGAIKKYLTVFSTISVFAGILFGLFMGLKVGLWDGVLAGIKFGIEGGGLMVLVLIPLDYLLTRKLPAKALNARQRCEICMKGDIKHIFEKCLTAMKGLSFIKTVFPVEEKMLLSANTKTSLLSFGENIELQFSAADREYVRINISSRPIVRFTLLDFGKNYRNVELIKENLTKNEGTDHSDQF